MKKLRKQLHLTMFLSVLLILGALFFVACEKPSETESTLPAEPVRDSAGAILISSAAELEFLREYPSEKFLITAEIDLGGKEWTPTPEFSGQLIGTWGGEFNHTISNFKIVGTGEENIGFFGTSSGAVRHLNFENVTIELPDGFSKSAGILAGEAKQSIINVNVTKSSVVGTDFAGTVGMIVGVQREFLERVKAEGTMTIKAKQGAEIGGICGALETSSSAQSKGDLIDQAESRVSMNVTSSDAITVGGVCGALVGNATDINTVSDFFTEAGEGSAIGVLVGSLENGTIRNSRSSAMSYHCLIGGEAKENRFTGRADSEDAVVNSFVRSVENLDRDLPADEYERRKTVERYMYMEVTTPWSPVADMHFTDSHPRHEQMYKKGETYFGLPYVHYCGSLEKFLYYRNEDGTLSEQVPTDKTMALYIGNDCADCVYWAWSRISGDISFTLTENMILRNGTIPVGNYEKKNHSKTTQEIIEANDEETMFESYAKLHMGDAVLYAPGHIRMVAENAYVYRNEDGTINPDVSYVLCHQQGASVSSVTENHTTCTAFKRYTFRNLLEKYYIPITVEAFKNGVTEPKLRVTNADGETVNGVWKGTVKTNYRINGIRGTVENEKGEVVWTASEFPCLSEHITIFNLSFAKESFEPSILKKGTYHYRLETLAAGKYVTLKEFEFKVE